MDFQTSKTLGGVGAILMFIMPFVGVYTGILGLIGLILVLIGLKGLADHYNEQGIFNNALYGVIMAIVGGVICIAIMAIAAVGLLTALGIDFTNWADWTAMEATFSRIDWTALMDFNTFWPYITVAIVSIVLLFIFVIIAAIFLRRSLNFLAAKSGVGLFSTTGLLLLIGALLTIIAIGLLLIWIALILLAVAFFSIRPTAPQPTATAPQPTQ